jgi:hypothetical protein
MLRPRCCDLGLVSDLEAPLLDLSLIDSRTIVERLLLAERHTV